VVLIQGKGPGVKIAIISVLVGFAISCSQPVLRRGAKSWSGNKGMASMLERRDQEICQSAWFIPRPLIPRPFGFRCAPAPLRETITTMIVSVVAMGQFFGVSGVK
jgi:hypothetical protein